MFEDINHLKTDDVTTLVNRADKAVYQNKKYYNE